MACHVELARHVRVLHEAVVEARARAHGHAAHQLGVVRGPGPRPRHQPAVVPGAVHGGALRHARAAGQLAVAHRRVGVEAARVGLRLEFVQLRGSREAREAAEAGPGGLLIEMETAGVRRGGDILDNDDTMITRNTGIASTREGSNPIISSLSGLRGNTKM